jgi:DHA1 family bicyclomycin/chloramphenicol resistance-like MFS transporter
LAGALKSDAGHMAWTILGYLIGFSLGQLLLGSIGDHHGRRIPISIGLVLFLAESAGCALSETGGEMIAWRVVQTIRASAGSCSPGRWRATFTRASAPRICFRR